MPWRAGETMAKPGASPWNIRRCVGPSPTCGTSAEAWNIAVRTRGVVTHRAGFQKLACAERSLVRTANQPLSQLRQLTLSDSVLD